MDERPKIHIFLGAPPPASILASDAETEEEERPPAGWRHLELTWRGGRLKPAADVPGNEAGISQFYSGNEDPEASNQGLDKTEDPTEPESDGTTEWKEGRWNTDGGSACERGGLRTETDGAEEDQCSASVQDYLDGCFPAAQPEPDSKPQPTPPPPSTRTQYLSTWTLSQALMLRGRHGVQSASSPEKTPPSVSSSTPELFSPTASSPGASMELFSPVCVSQRVEQGGVIMEATAEGVLCSQESRAPQDSPTRPPCSKKPKPCEDSKAAGGQSSSSTIAASLQSPTTPLDRCRRLGLRFSVLVVVVHPCHLKEVQVKSGPSAGAFVPLASIVVTDQSGAEMKVVLWRRAAFWVLTVNPGDVLLITGLQVNEDKWRGETVLQSTFSSKLLNLGHASQPALTAANQRPPSLATQHVSARSLSSLCEFIRERRPLLVSLPSRAPQDLNRLPYVTLRTMRVNTLVHVLLRVKHSQLSPGWRNEAESRSRSGVQLKTVLTVEQPDGQQGALLLWGAAMDWLPRLQRHREAVWDFRVLLVREGLTSDLLELHSTPWSLVRVLDPRDPRALDFDQAWYRQKGRSVPLELDLDTMLSQKYSGEVELRVQVLSFQFQEAPPSQNPPQPVLDSSTRLDAILTALGGDVTYTGCARCSAELDTDENGIYTTCYPCLPHTAVRRFYRSAVVTVSRPGCALLGVRVPPVPLQKILHAPPDRLHRSSAPGSPVRNIQVAAEKIQTLLSLPRKTVIIIIRSHFLCDENSVPISQDFTLLDLRFPGP